MLILIGYDGDRDAGAQGDGATLTDLAAAVADRLDIPVEAAYLEGSPSVGEGIQIGVETRAARRITVLPLFLGASVAKQNNVEQIIDAARDRWNDVIVQYGESLGAHPGVLTAYSRLFGAALRDNPSGIPYEEAALLVVGRGSRSPDANAEVYRFARRLWERLPCGAVEIGFTGRTQPDIPAAIRRCIASGARRVVVVPYLLYEPALYETICRKVEGQQNAHPGIDLRIAAPLGVHESIVEAVIERYQTAQTNPAALARSIHSHSHGAGGSHTHAVAPDLSSLLPPRYQGDVSVSAVPMGAADLIFDAAGQVAWDEIWGSFCDLALAGGPPHRGTLLEPVSPDAVRADPEGYQRVLAELERGIRMVTKLPVVTSASPGWIGVQCASEDMALWLLRAIVVENVSVRREGDVLYLPAGPDFRLEKEIKNVVTVIAKTRHYWAEHLDAKTQHP